MAFLCLDLFLSFTNRTYNFFQGISVQFRDRSVKYMSFEMGRYQPDEVGVSEEFAKSKKTVYGTADGYDVVVRCTRTTTEDVRST
jgi:hypothetical protein